MGQECSSNGCSNASVRNASNIEKQHDEDGNLTEFEGELQVTQPTKEEAPLTTQGGAEILDESATDVAFSVYSMTSLGTYNSLDIESVKKNVFFYIFLKLFFFS